MAQKVAFLTSVRRRYPFAWPYHKVVSVSLSVGGRISITEQP
jgi:hypothetical protein